MNKHPLKVLIVDDEPELAQLLVQRLRAAGLEAEMAQDGAAGLRVAAAWRPDVIVLDVSMPGLDGWQLCRALKGNRKTEQAALIVMTAWATAGLELRAKREGARALLLKPFDERKIAHVVREAAGVAA